MLTIYISYYGTRRGISIGSLRLYQGPGHEFRRRRPNQATKVRKTRPTQNNFANGLNSAVAGAGTEGAEDLFIKGPLISAGIRINRL